VAVPPHVQECQEPMLPLPWKKRRLATMKAVWESRPNGAACRSTAAKSQAAWRAGAAAQWTCRPQGPLPVRQEVQTKPRGVSALFGLCFRKSASRTPEQSVAQCTPAVWSSSTLRPVPSAVRPQPAAGPRKKPWPMQESW